VSKTLKIYTNERDYHCLFFFTDDKLNEMVDGFVNNKGSLKVVLKSKDGVREQGFEFPEKPKK